jgi:hypothetical protein
MLTDLPASGLEEIARRLKLTLPEPEVEPVPPAEVEPEPELELTPAPARVPAQAPAAESAPEAVAEPAPAAVSAPVAIPMPARTPMIVERGPVLAALPLAELEELAREQFTRVVHGPAEVPATDELYEHLRTAGLDRIDAFAYQVEDGRPVVVVRPSSAPEGARTLHRVVRTPAPEAVWQVVDVWIGVPISMVRNPPADLLEAHYYAVH